jgi:hypothetical protein
MSWRFVLPGGGYIGDILVDHTLTIGIGVIDTTITAIPGIDSVNPMPAFGIDGIGIHEITDNHNQSHYSQ